jgi:hypothetical protein
VWQCERDTFDAGWRPVVGFLNVLMNFRFSKMLGVSKPGEEVLDSEGAFFMELGYL